MERWTASAAGGMSQRLYPRGATVRSRLSSDIRTTPSSRAPVRCIQVPAVVCKDATTGALPLVLLRDPAASVSDTIRAMRRVLPLLLLALTVALVLAPVALGHDGGEGTYGETNDKVVTNAGFVLIAFFPLFVFAMSMLQMSLARRKDRRKAARKALAREDRGRGGW